MVARKRKIAPKGIRGRLSRTGKAPTAKFTVFGEEMIEKEVGLGGNTGRIYLPPGWVGKRVKIIRMD